MQQKKSQTTWIVCGVIALAAVCIGAFVLMGGVGLLAWFGQDPAGLAVSMNVPPAAAGETFDLSVMITNTGEKAMTVSEIELPNSVLSGAAVQQINPAPVGQASTSSSMKYKVNLALQPGESREIVFTMKAQSEGSFTGDVNVYVGSRYSITPLTVRVAGSQAAPVKTEVASVPAATAPAATIPASPGGKIAGVPYEAVVQIIALVEMEGELTPAWSGSGSIVTPDGLVLTNAHVVLSDRYYEVKDLVVALTVSPEELPVATYFASVMQVDEALDIAVIRIETDLDRNPVDRASLNLPTVPMGDSETMRLGDPLVILGYPTIGGSTITLTRGEVSGFTAEEGYGNRAFIKTSATISGGNSGGLAANASGELIGIPTQLGYGGDDQYVDCRVLVDTNRDGVVDDNDNCVPTGGFINALRPIRLAQPYIQAAQNGETNFVVGVQGEQGEVPQEASFTTYYEDDFSDPNSGWDDTEWDEGYVRYQDGEYYMSVYPANWLTWSYQEDNLTDMLVSVDTHIIAMTGVGDYGVICRYVDDNNYYGLEVSEDGYFSIWKVINGETIFIYDWEYSDSIPAGQAFRIDAACIGNNLILGVNDVLLAQVTDDSLTSGGYGMILGTFDNPAFTVAFDNFTVLQP